MIDLLVIGNITRDSIRLTRHGETLRRLGGAALYTGIVASKLGMNVAIVSKVGRDFGVLEWEWLRKTRLRCFIKRGLNTALFHISYNKERTLSLLKDGPRLELKDIPTGLSSKCVHIGSVASEIPARQIRSFLSLAKYSSLDAQGYTRNSKATSHVSTGNLMLPGALEGITLLKASLEEASILVRQQDRRKIIGGLLGLGPKIVACTLGEQGAIVADRNRAYSLPRYPVCRVLDPTGAGDAFVAGFWYEYQRSRDPVSAGITGAAAASVLVETDRLGLDATLREISKRAMILKNKTQKLRF